MGESCAIKPIIINNKGEKMVSRLFEGLLTYTNYKRANELYRGAVSDEFIESYGDILPMDENGEFYPEHIAIIAKIIPEELYLKQLNILYGRNNKLGNIIQYEFELASSKVKEFNKTNPLSKLYHAEVKFASNGKYHIIIEPGKFGVTSSVLYYSLDDEMEYNENLNNKIKESMSKHGIASGALTELERRMKVGGVMDATSSSKIIDGLQEIIRLADGERGERALPEEYAHFIVEALGTNNPLVSRLMGIINNNNLVPEILGDSYEGYKEAYDNNDILMSKEALGKLIARHFLQNLKIEDNRIKPMLTRLIEGIKNFFKNLKKRGFSIELNKARYDLNKTASKLASDVINGKLDDQINIDNINKSQVKLYDVKDRINNEKKILENIIQSEVEKLKISKKRNLSESAEYVLLSYIDQLESYLERGEYQEGMYNFLDNTMSELDNSFKTLKELYKQKDNPEKLNEVAGQLRGLRNYMASYSRMLGEIKKEMGTNLLEDEDRFDAKLRARVKEVNELNEELSSQFSNIAKPLFLKFLSKFTEEEITIKIGKHKGEVIKISELLETPDRDISFFDRWLDAMSDSSDIMLRLFSAATEDYKLNALLATLNYVKRLQAALAKLEESGIKDTKFMFEHDKNNNLTGRYKSDIDYVRFEKEKDAFYKSITKDYNGSNLTPELITSIRLSRDSWFVNNTEIINGKRVPKKSIYRSNDFSNLNPAQKEYYNTIVNLKKEVDSFLPQGNKLNLKAVLIRKDTVERVLSTKNLKDGINVIKEAARDIFVRREDDTEYGHNKKSTLIDFEGHKVMTLPIYFTHNLDNMNDLSTDVTSTMAAYAAMAVDYNEMNKVINVLEVGRDLMREREVAVTEGDKPLILTIKGLGKTILKKLTKGKWEENSIARLNDFFDMRIYGRYINDEGTIANTELDKAKLLGFIGTMTAVNNMALNSLAGISNVATGSVMANIEAAAGLFFGVKNLSNADKIYIRDLMELMSQMGSKIKTSKLALFIELFNVMQDYEARSRELQMDRKGISRLFHMNSIFFLTNCGEHWMQTRTALALSDRHKMKSPTGEIVPLYEALEVVPFDGKDLKHGGKLVVKKGYTNEDGSEFSEKDTKSFMNRTRYINDKLHGIYNKADMNAAQKMGTFRLCYQFRKWMRSAYIRRISGANYNFVAEDWTEGYYTTTFGFIGQLIKDLKAQEFHIAANWKNLDPIEKANIKRALTEVGHFIAVSGVLMMVDWSGGDDDRSWLSRMLEYQLRRLLNELGATTPTPFLALDAFRMFKSPAAGIDYIERLLKIFNLSSYFDVIEQGRYKGMYKGTKYWLETLPANRTIYKGLHPENSIIFYQSGF